MRWVTGRRTALQDGRKNVWDADPAMSDMVAAEEGIRRYEAFINELGVPSRLSQSELARIGGTPGKMRG